jgi:hypothetical protein
MVIIQLEQHGIAGGHATVAWRVVLADMAVVISKSEARGPNIGPDRTNEAVSRGTIARMSLLCMTRNE